MSMVLVMSNLMTKRKAGKKGSEAGSEGGAGIVGGEDEPEHKEAAAIAGGEEASEPQAVQLANIPCLNLQMQGAGKQCEVVVEPPLLAMPGELLAGATYRRRLRLVNQSTASTVFSWKARQ